MLRFNYVGELGWELHHPIEQQNPLFDALTEAGREFGLALIGGRAIDSLRLEKSYRAFWHDLTPEYSALEAGLDRLINLRKPNFPGKEALLRERAAGLARRFTVLEIAAGGIEPYQNETVYRNGKPVGRISSGGYGHLVGKALAHAYVDAPHYADGTELEVLALGERRAAKVIRPAPYDPSNARPRL
jgi:dimethylglycine dehydrogenase